MKHIKTNNQENKAKKEFEALCKKHRIASFSSGTFFVDNGRDMNYKEKLAGLSAILPSIIALDSEVDENIVSGD